MKLTFPQVLMVAFLAASVQITSAQPATMPDFADLVERTAPAVVNIRTAARVSMTAPGQQPQIPELDENDPFYEFFHRFFPQPGPGQRPGPMPKSPHGEQEIPRGVGSGFLISSDGYLLTNHHVVEGADEITVTLPDKREFKGKLIGSDPRTDVALVKIEGGTDLPTLKIGDPAKLRVGEWVIAIGSPFNLQNTVTAGIVSAKSRETGELLPFIQTDAAVNPGNSGGPLINIRGEVVGINSQIFTTSGAYAGISFAIPIDEAQKIAKILRAQGKVVRGKIGVLIGEVSREVAEAIGLPKAAGAAVSSVENDGPAEKAGVQPGDVIIKYDGKPVESSADLRRMVASTTPGTKVTTTVWRDGAPRDLLLTVGEMPQEPARPGMRGSAPGKAPESHPDVLGLVVSDVTAAQLKELHIEVGAVQVDSADGPAAAAGLRPGDLIVSVNASHVKNVKQFNELLKGIDLKKPIALLVRRGDQSQRVIVHVGDN
ncbi:MAG TPA: DegQ family serine endoprotease [Burkholderiaceae bacterium]|nr:DegQ family serine endoprotease [Burkholderiaceae bacterium]